MDIEPLIEKQIRKLINNENVDTFWIGGDGWFDIYVSGILQKLKQEYPYIKIILIVANPRQLEFQENKFPFDDFKYPEEVKSVPLEKAVFSRNHYMVTNTDYIIVYPNDKHSAILSVLKEDKIRVINFIN